MKSLQFNFVRRGHKHSDILDTGWDIVMQRPGGTSYYGISGGQLPSADCMRRVPTLAIPWKLRTYEKVLFPSIFPNIRCLKSCFPLFGAQQQLRLAWPHLAKISIAFQYPVSDILKNKQTFVVFFGLVIVWKQGMWSLTVRTKLGWFAYIWKTMSEQLCQHCCDKHTLAHTTTYTYTYTYSIIHTKETHAHWFLHSHHKYNLKTTKLEKRKTYAHDTHTHTHIMKLVHCGTARSSLTVVCVCVCVCFGSSSYQHQRSLYKVTVMCVCVCVSVVWGCVVWGCEKNNQHTTHNRIFILQGIKGLYDVLFAGALVWCVWMCVSNSELGCVAGLCVCVQDYSWLEMNCVGGFMSVCVCMHLPVWMCVLGMHQHDTIEYGFLSKWKILWHDVVCRFVCVYMKNVCVHVFDCIAVLFLYLFIYLFILYLFIYLTRKVPLR